jgi:hypothetical protein
MIAEVHLKVRKTSLVHTEEYLKYIKEYLDKLDSPTEVVSVLFRSETDNE